MSAVAIVVCQGPPGCSIHKPRKSGCPDDRPEVSNRRRRNGDRGLYATIRGSLWGATVVVNQKLAMDVANLHDVFMNASVVKRAMDVSPIPAHAEQFHFSDRGRLERLWIALLQVLIEAWHSKQLREAREHIMSATDASALVQLLREAGGSEHRQRLQENRGYMFHRDKRKYWDAGRMGPVGHLEFHTRLHLEFSRVLLAGLQSVTSGNGADR